MKSCILAFSLLFPISLSYAQTAGHPLAKSQRILSDLQTMGIPADVAVSSEPLAITLTFYKGVPLRPTALGRRMHEILSRFTERERAQLQFKLARNDYAALAEAARLLDRAAIYDRKSVTEAYPELAKAYAAKAEGILRPSPDSALPNPGKSAASVREVLLKHREELKAKQAALESESKSIAHALAGALGDSGAAAELRASVRGELRAFREAAIAIDALAGSPHGRGRLTSRGLLSLVKTLPEESLSAAQWKAVASAFPMGESINRMGIMELWRAGLTGKGMRIGVIDDGADIKHPDLDGIRVGNNYTFERHLEGPRTGQPDDRGEHGTHVSGIIHALAPEAEIRVYKMLERENAKIPPQLRLNGAQQEEVMAQALRCAAKDGCTAINMSLGDADNANLIYVDAVDRRLKELDNKHIAVVVASGNEGPDTVDSPGNSADVIAVGAASYVNRQAFFSSRGEVYQALPNGEGQILRKPDCLAYGVNVCSAKFDPSSRYDHPKDDYVRWDGTSMATPHVTAVVSLMQQKAKELGRPLTSAEARRLLNETGAPAADGPYDTKIVDPVKAIERLSAEAGTR